MKLFEYAIIWNPDEGQKKEGVRSKLICGVKQVLATDQKSATLAAAREIPKEYENDLDQLEVAVRPF